MEPSTSRSRAPNFTHEEQILLCKALKPYKHTIESKKTDSVRHAQKQEAWKKVTEAYNANTKYVPRSRGNLISCYRNLKSRWKKQHSDAKMVLADSGQKNDFLTAMESHGKDWEEVGKIIKKPPEGCKNVFSNLNSSLKKKENVHKKNIVSTDGDPPPFDTNDTLDSIKKNLEPQMDVIFTIHEGDPLLMKPYQKTLPDKDRKLPIESTFDKVFILPMMEDDTQITEKEIQHIDDEVEVPKRVEEEVIPVHHKSINRTDIPRKKRSSAWTFDDKAERLSKKKQKVNDNFIRLSQQKLELVNLQKKLVEEDIAHNKKIHELQLENIIKQNAHNEEIRKKELILIDLKIKSASQGS